ncbi:putative two-component sensor kinase NtrY domain protein [Neisseria meningitidis NM003]|nr:putative two-component sensor kinase NtrY domain protein [Neisseria meningitidis NM003]
MRRFLPIAAICAVVLLYGLTAATGSTSSLADYFWWIVAFSAMLLLVLSAVLARYVILLLKDRRDGVFGSQIAKRLSGMFTLVAVLPGVFLFGVSAQFINGTINSWFGNDTHEALERSLNLSKSALNLAADNALGNAIPVQIDLISTASLSGNMGRCWNIMPTGLHSCPFTMPQAAKSKKASTRTSSISRFRIRRVGKKSNRRVRSGIWKA